MFDKMESLCHLDTSGNIREIYQRIKRKVCVPKNIELSGEFGNIPVAFCCIPCSAELLNNLKKNITQILELQLSYELNTIYKGFIHDDEIFLLVNATLTWFISDDKFEELVGIPKDILEKRDISNATEQLFNYAMKQFIPVMEESYHILHQFPA